MLPLLPATVEKPSLCRVLVGLHCLRGEVEGDKCEEREEVGKNLRKRHDKVVDIGVFAGLDHDVLRHVVGSNTQ